jgi:hypothetical protein
MYFYAYNINIININNKLMRTIQFLDILVQLNPTNDSVSSKPEKNGNQDYICIKPFRIENVSDNCFPTRNLLQDSFIQMFIIFIS